MPAPLTAAGYQDLREHVAAEWTHIAFFFETTELFRPPLSDSRVTVESDGTANPVTIRADLAGDDAELGSLPTSIDGTALFKVAEAGDALASNTHTVFTFSDAADECTFRHTVQLPVIE